MLGDGFGVSFLFPHSAVPTDAAVSAVSTVPTELYSNPAESTDAAVPTEVYSNPAEPTDAAVPTEVYANSAESTVSTDAAVSARLLPDVWLKKSREEGMLHSVNRLLLVVRIVVRVDVPFRQAGVRNDPKSLTDAWDAYGK
jgi:hypothetical protein